jgi:phasin family protein
MSEQTIKTETPTAAAAEAPKAEAKVDTPAAKAEAKPARAKTAKPRRKAARAAKPAQRKAVVETTSRATVAAKPAAKRGTRKSNPRKAAPVRAAAMKFQGAPTMTKTIDTGLFAADQFKNVFGDVNERAKAAAERSAKIVEEIADLTRGNVEAFVASSKVAAKGVERLSQEAAEYSRKSFEEASAALKNAAEIKSATELFRLQGDFARAAFDNVVAESARFSETVLKLAGDVAEPITNRYTVAAERAKTLAA